MMQNAQDDHSQEAPLPPGNYWNVVQFHRDFPEHPSLHPFDNKFNFGFHSSQEVTFILEDPRPLSLVQFNNDDPGAYANVEQVARGHFERENKSAKWQERFIPEGEKFERFRSGGPTLTLVTSLQPGAYGHTVDLTTRIGEISYEYPFRFDDIPGRHGCVRSEDTGMMIVGDTSDSAVHITPRDVAQSTADYLSKRIDRPCVFRVERDPTVPSLIDPEVLRKYVRAIIHPGAIVLSDEDPTLTAEKTLVRHRLGPNAKDSQEAFMRLLKMSRDFEIPYILPSWKLSGGGRLPGGTGESKHWSSLTKNDQAQQSDFDSLLNRDMHPHDIARLESCMRTSMRRSLLTACQALAFLSGERDQEMVDEISAICLKSREQVVPPKQGSEDMISRIKAWTSPCLDPKRYAADICSAESLTDLEEIIGVAHNPIFGYPGVTISSLWNGTPHHVVYVPVNIDHVEGSAIHLRPVMDMKSTTYLAVARPGTSSLGEPIPYTAESSAKRGYVPTKRLHFLRAMDSPDTPSFVQRDRGQEWQCFTGILGDILSRCSDLVDSNVKGLSEEQSQRTSEVIQSAIHRLKSGAMTAACQMWVERAQWCEDDEGLGIDP